MFVVKLPNPTQSFDEVIGIVMVLIWVITYPADLELQPSILDSTCSDLLPTLRPITDLNWFLKLLLLTRFAI